jgi:hypothetical protein
MIRAAAVLAHPDPLQDLLCQRRGHRAGPVGDPGAFPPDHIGQLAHAALAVIASVTNPDRNGRNNPR